MGQQGRMGMTKTAKKADRLNRMQGNRKREKASNRSHYHSEFKRNTGYPRKGKKKSFGAPQRKYNDCGFLGASKGSTK